MREIDYGLYDSCSGLPIESLTDKYVRTLADLDNKTCSDTHNMLQKEIQKIGIKYMICKDSKVIRVVPKPVMSACAPEYFDTYEQAQNSIACIS